MSVAYGRYEEAFRAIHSALSEITAAPAGHRVTKLAFSWNVDGSLASLSAFDGATQLFTLTFNWNTDGTLREISRTEG